MVLRCSLLGHEYGEPDVEREREERGSEVVVTVQEYEECTRCGDRHLISENTEVRSLPRESADDGIEPPASGGAAVDERDGGRDRTDPDAATVDADRADPDPSIPPSERPDPAEASEPEESPPRPEQAEAADAHPAQSADSEIPTDEHGEPITDDGVILEDEEDEPLAREPGEWPESDDVGPPLGSENDPTDWPEPDPDLSFEELSTEAELEMSDDSGDDSIDEGVILEDEDEPDAADPATVDATGSRAATGSLDSGTGIERAAAAPTPGEAAPLENVPTEFYCPRCGFVAPGNRGSLRTGDICPECRRGYLGERER